jgi:hypothetical protein
MNEQWVLIFGNPTDGFAFTGPFKSHAKAVETAKEMELGDWWVDILNKPALEMSE